MWRTSVYGMSWYQWRTADVVYGVPPCTGRHGTNGGPPMRRISVYCVGNRKTKGGLVEGSHQWPSNNGGPPMWRTSVYGMSWYQWRTADVAYGVSPCTG